MCQADSLVALILINTICTQNFHFLGGLCGRLQRMLPVHASMRVWGNPLSSNNKKVIADPTACYSCGVCRAICNKKAITLSPPERWKKRPTCGDVGAGEVWKVTRSSNAIVIFQSPNNVSTFFFSSRFVIYSECFTIQWGSDFPFSLPIILT